MHVNWKSLLLDKNVISNNCIYWIFYCIELLELACIDSCFFLIYNFVKLRNHCQKFVNHLSGPELYNSSELARFWVLPAFRFWALLQKYSDLARVYSTQILPAFRFHWLARYWSQLGILLPSGSKPDLARFQLESVCLHFRAPIRTTRPWQTNSARMITEN